jgi:hypothetical protein
MNTYKRHRFPPGLCEDSCEFTKIGSATQLAVDVYGPACHSVEFNGFYCAREVAAVLQA